MSKKSKRRTVKSRCKLKHAVVISSEDYSRLLLAAEERDRLLRVVENPDGAVQRKFSRLLLKLAEHIQNFLLGRTVRSDMLVGFFLRQRENKKLIAEIMREP